MNTAALPYPRPDTAAVAGALATAAVPFRDLLGTIRADELLALVRTELGHERILDGFQPHGPDDHLALARAREPILHVISGNTPHAGLQSLIRGLLVGAHNLCKLPGGYVLPELPAFRAALPPWLARRVEFSETLPDAWLARAGTVIVFGSDDTVDALHRRLRPDQAFVAHGHRVSLALILDDPGGESLPAAARAVSLFDQRGCLSPHVLYVRGEALRYAAGLAGEMARFNAHTPRVALSPAEAAPIMSLREEWRFRAANDPAGHALWHSQGSTAWTVLYDGLDPAFTASPLQRAVYVKPLPDDLPAALATVRPFVSTVGLWPARTEDAAALAALDLGASRFCPLDRMQLPPLTWHQDGSPPLSALVRWIDFEPG